MKFTLLLAALPATLAAVLPRESSSIAPEGARVASVVFGGTGCPEGSLSPNSLPALDKTFEWTIKSDQFTATTADITQSRKICQININIDVPAGYQYQVAASRYKGALNLPAGTTALQKALYYFTGETDQLASDNEFKGPIKSHYYIEDVLPEKTSPWSACGQSPLLNVASQIRVDNAGSPKATAQATGSINNEITFSLDLKWRAC